MDDLLASYADVWNFLKDYHARYDTMPSIKTVQDKIPGFQEVDVEEDTRFYLSELREEFIGSRIDSVLMNAAHARGQGGLSSSEILAKLEEAFAGLNRYSAYSRDVNVMDLDSAEQRFKETRERAAAMGGIPGIATGVGFIDDAYPSGMAPGDLVVMLGWTGRGKSLLSTLIGCNANERNRKVLVVSLEMSGEKVQDRVLTIKGSGLFRNSDLNNGIYDEENFEEFRKAVKDSPEFIVVNNENVSEVTPNVIEAKIDQYNSDVVILDYAQLSSDNANSQDMTARMRNLSKECKRLAVKKGVVFILISSATPDNGKAVDAPPIIEDVAWSKQLAYDADLAFAVHKDSESNLIQIVCRKNRNGPLFAGILDWDINNGIVHEHFA